jgi:alpha-L-arabinofuranosidase
MLKKYKKIIIISLLSGLALGFVFNHIIRVRVDFQPRFGTFLAKVEQASQFPAPEVKDVLELCTFEQKTDINRVEGDGAELDISSQQASQGKYSLKCAFAAGGGAFEFYSTLPKDWTGYKYLKFEVYSKESDVPLSLFIADTENRSYGRRFNKEGIKLHGGWNLIEIPIPDIDRKLILNKINHLRIFLWKVSGAHTLYFDNFRLVSVPSEVSPKLTAQPKVQEVKDVLELNSFEKDADIKWIGTEGSVIERVKENASSGSHSLKCEFADGGGAFEFYAILPKNWSGYKYFKFDVYSEQDKIPLSLFIADTKHTSYAQRFNLEGKRLNKGRNKIEVSVADIERKLDVKSINHVRIFLWKVSGKNRLYFDNFRLVSDESADSKKTEKTKISQPAISEKDVVSKTEGHAPINITIDPAKEIRPISRLLYGSNLVPRNESDYKIRWFIKDIGLTCLRFPGGGSPGWHWKTGEADYNTKIKNMPLGKIDYLIDFCKDTNTEIIMQVNLETGTPQEAAELVEYMNNKKGFRVDYWEIGNEANGEWDKAYTTPDNYHKQLKAYSEAMKAVDPRIKIGANWGEEYYDNVQWDQTIMKYAADYIDFVSYHWYPNHIGKRHVYKGRKHPLAEEVMANAFQIPYIVERVEKLIAQYAPHRKGKIETCFLEWDGSWDAPISDLPPYEQGIAQWSLANAIFYADCFGQFAQSGVTVSTHYDLQECSYGLIRGWDINEGWGGEKWDQNTVRPKAYAIKLFAKHFGDILIESKVENSPSYEKPKDWWPSSYAGEVPYVTCYASKFSSQNKLGIILINKHSDKNFDVRISLKSVNKVNNVSHIWLLTGPDLMSQNDGSPDMVKIHELVTDKMSEYFVYTLPAHSVVAIEVELL